MTIHILLATQRSGTGALGSVLDQHPGIKYLGELFHPDEIKREQNYFNFLLKKIQADPQRGLPMAGEQNYREFMDHIEKTVPGQNVFVDVKYSSTHHFNGPWHSPFDMPRFMQYCIRDQRKILHLKRKNYLKTFISGRLAEMNKVWHAKKDDKITVTTLNVNTGQLLNSLRTSLRTENHFNGYLRKYPRILVLEYEELFGPDGVSKELLRKVAGFLEIEPAPFEAVKPAFVKQTSDELSTVIENYADVVAALKGTEFEWMAQQK